MGRNLMKIIFPWFHRRAKNMGTADFYLKINYVNHNYDEFETIYQLFANESIFRILNKENELNFLSVECQFDNFVTSIIIAFNNLSPFKDNIASVETCGVVKEFIFISVEEFLEYIFSINKNKLLTYYNQMGYLGIDSKDYYKKRIKLRKYYKKLK